MAQVQLVMDDQEVVRHFTKENLRALFSFKESTPCETADLLKSETKQLKTDFQLTAALDSAEVCLFPECFADATDTLYCALASQDPLVKSAPRALVTFLFSRKSTDPITPLQRETAEDDDSGATNDDETAEEEGQDIKLDTPKASSSSSSSSASSSASSSSSAASASASASASTASAPSSSSSSSSSASNDSIDALLDLNLPSGAAPPAPPQLQAAAALAPATSPLVLQQLMQKADAMLASEPAFVPPPYQSPDLPKRKRKGRNEVRVQLRSSFVCSLLSRPCGGVQIISKHGIQYLDGDDSGEEEWKPA